MKKISIPQINGIFKILYHFLYKMQKNHEGAMCRLRITPSLPLIMP